VYLRRVKGSSIGTLDNPGWSLTIDLAHTDLSGRPFVERHYGLFDQAETSGHEWIHCKVEDDKFIGNGGPAKLEEMISVFLEWTKAAN
jgi:Immunity protein 53